MAAELVTRSVQWVQVAGRWTRMSIMGTGLPLEKLGTEPARLFDRDDSTLNTVILMIPGNPGNEGFYEKFGTNLLERLNEREALNNSDTADNSDWLTVRKRYFFVTVSHLNHVMMPKQWEATGEHRSDERFLLTEQVQHKLDFCREYLPKTDSLFLLGHSIGAYMMLRILPMLLEDGYNVVRACSLFPTIERMAETPNGRRLSGILKFASNNDWLVRLLFLWLDWLPVNWKRWLCNWHLRKAVPPACVLESAMELLQLDVLRNIIYMSNDELDTVRELDQELLQPVDRLRFHYGISDGWCPIEFAREIQEIIPVEQIRMDEDGCEHAFVIRDSEIMAQRLLDWID